MPAARRKAITSEHLILIPYDRWSDPKQGKGDSERRQRDALQAYARRYGHTIDLTRRCVDRGVSAYTGKNAKEGEFKRIVDAAESGEIGDQYAVVIEATDRATRQDLDDSEVLLFKILRAGVKIITLSPERVYDRASLNNFMARVELMTFIKLGYEESRRKSERVTAAKVVEREKARDEGKIIPAAVPAWFQRKDGKLVLSDKGKPVLDPDAVAIIKTVCRMAVDGEGLVPIARKLNAEKVPTLGYKANAPTTWSGPMVHGLLSNRALIGEFQPHTGRTRATRKPVGPPITKYFASAVTEKLYYQVQASLKERAVSGRGRKGRHVNLFAGLLTLEGGGKHNGITYKHSESDRTWLIPTGPKLGRGDVAYTSFPAAIFEAGLIRFLWEVKPRDVLPREDDGTDEVENQEAKLLDVEKRIENLKARLVEGDLDLVDVVRRMGVERQQVKADLEAARRAAATPATIAMKQVKSFHEAMASGKGDDEELRLRARTAIRGVLDKVEVAFSSEGRGRSRKCTARVYFKGQDQRLKITMVIIEADRDGTWTSTRLSVYPSNAGPVPVSPHCIHQGGTDPCHTAH